jgi:thioredoxin reductase (NADPH)
LSQYSVNTQKMFDVIIIGGGPAGLSAGIYTARAGRSTLLIERMAIGGQAINTSLVENYPGFEGISGIDLTQSMYRQAKKFGIEELYTEVTGIESKGENKLVKTSQGDFSARTVILAAGLERQKLGVPGEAEFTGRGVSYCATCDGAFFRNKAVVVVGGGNAALTEALELTRFASKVTVIHRRNELRATKILQDKAFNEPKLEFLWDSAIEAITGDAAVKKVIVRHVKSREKTTLEVSGIFIAVGFRPNTGYLKGIVELDENGAVMTNAKMETNQPGVLAAGDIRSGSIRQLIAAAGDGAVAAISAERYLSGHA